MKSRDIPFKLSKAFSGKPRLLDHDPIEVRQIQATGARHENHRFHRFHGSAPGMRRSFETKVAAVAALSEPKSGKRGASV